MVIEAKDLDQFAEQLDNYNIAGSQTTLEPVEANEGEVVELEEGEELYEMEVDEDAILYYIEDEEGNEIGFAIEEDGKPVEYFYAEDEHAEGCDCGCHDEELYEMEVDEDAILYYIEDEEGNEIGFAIEEDGKPVEYFYAEDEVEEAPVPAAAPAPQPAPKKDEGVLGAIRSKTDGFLAKAEDKLDNGEMSDETKKIMGGVAEAADTMKDIKDTLKEFKEAFSFKL